MKEEKEESGIPEGLKSVLAILALTAMVLITVAVWGVDWRLGLATAGWWLWQIAWNGKEWVDEKERSDLEN